MAAQQRSAGAQTAAGQSAPDTAGHASSDAPYEAGTRSQQSVDVSTEAIRVVNVPSIAVAPSAGCEVTAVPTSPGAPPFVRTEAAHSDPVSWRVSDSSDTNSAASFGSVERAVRCHRRSPLDQLRGLACNAAACGPPLASVRHAGREGGVAGLTPRRIAACAEPLAIKVEADVSVLWRPQMRSAGSALRGWSGGGDGDGAHGQAMEAIAVAPVSEHTASPFAPDVSQRAERDAAAKAAKRQGRADFR